jgi:hypothetical protein
MPEYEIRLRGPIDPSWSDWFCGLEVSSTSTSDTLLSGFVVDQAALHGILLRIRDLSLELISLRQLNA